MIQIWGMLWIGIKKRKCISLKNSPLCAPQFQSRSIKAKENVQRVNVLKTWQLIIIIVFLIITHLSSKILSNNAKILRFLNNWSCTFFGMFFVFFSNSNFFGAIFSSSCIFAFCNFFCKFSWLLLEKFRLFSA